MWFSRLAINEEQIDMRFEIDEDFWDVSLELLSIIDEISLESYEYDWDHVIEIKHEDNVLWYIRYEISQDWKQAHIRDFVTINFNKWEKSIDENYLEYAKNLVSEYLIWMQEYSWLGKNLLLTLISDLKKRWVTKVILNPFGSSVDFYYKFSQLARSTKLVKFAFHSKWNNEFTYIL